MKTKKRILTILALSIAAIGFATETPKMKVIQLEPEIAMVSFQAANPTNFELTICNYKNEVVYYHKSTQRICDYQGKFDFSSLKKGTYHLCLNYGNQSLNNKLTVSKNGIVADETEHLYKPWFSYENNKLNISFLNVSQHPVFVNIYKGKEHVSGVNLGKEYCIQKCLNLTKLEEGNYHVVVSDGDKEHRYDLCTKEQSF